MDIDSIGKVTSIVTGLLQAGAVVTAAVAGMRGLNAWRQQLVGGKQIALAEEALVAAHDVFRALQEARNPFSYKGEGESRKPQEEETKEQARSRNVFLFRSNGFRPRPNALTMFLGLLSRAASRMPKKAFGDSR